MTFDEVVPTLVRVVEGWATMPTPPAVAIVRDLRGLVRVVLQFDSESTAHAVSDAALDALRGSLTHTLGAWFAGEVLSSHHGRPQAQAVAQAVFKSATPMPQGASGDVLPPTLSWRIVEARLGKQPWLRAVTASVSKHDDDPRVVTFYSFKGGVGRSTTLAACALLAAKAGERVVVVDLDLEAPGLGSLFGVDPRAGVLDVLVDHMATGTFALPVLPLTETAATALSLDERALQVVPAGVLGLGYLEKLARLDFTSSALDAAATSPVQTALRALLEGIRTTCDAQWIFLDARAGLHDLAGLSLHGLADVDVLFARNNPQGHDGLGVVLEALAQQRNDAVAVRTVLVHAMAPTDADEAESARKKLRKHTYDLFKRLPSLGTVVDEEADDADHAPWTVRQDKYVEDARSLKALWDRVQPDDSDFRKVWDRVRSLAARGG